MGEGNCTYLMPTWRGGEEGGDRLYYEHVPISEVHCTALFLFFFLKKVPTRNLSVDSARVDGEQDLVEAPLEPVPQDGLLQAHPGREFLEGNNQGQPLPVAGRGKRK